MNARLRLVDGGALAPTDPAGETGLLECECGDAWFEIVEGHANGAIAIERDGRVSALLGELRCASCGRARDLE